MIRRGRLSIACVSVSCRRAEVAETGPVSDNGGAEAVVFDLDGVLIDSEPLWEQVRRQVVAEYG
ncbi:hypothetical protein Z051_25000, partial [Rhodococcus rhodochrous KG-21]